MFVSRSLDYPSTVSSHMSALSSRGPLSLPHQLWSTLRHHSLTVRKLPSPPCKNRNTPSAISLLSKASFQSSYPLVTAVLGCVFFRFCVHHPRGCCMVPQSKTGMFRPECSLGEHWRERGADGKAWCALEPQSAWGCRHRTPQRMDGTTHSTPYGGLGVQGQRTGKLGLAPSLAP